MRGAPAISGTVRDGSTGRPLADARVEITGAVRFETWLGARAVPYGDVWDGLEERADRVRTNRDGHFHFVDLPPGRYTVVASLPGATTRYGTARATARVPASGGAEVPSVELALPATTVAGKVSGPGSTPVALARVTVEGSGESTLSDAAGAYVLAGLETGPRTIRAERRGLAPASGAVKIATPGTQHRVDLQLG